MIDLLVAGGGPVGLATALYARRAGLDVVVAEPRRAPIDKACGEGLMPGGLRALRDLHVDPPGVALTGIRYLDEHHSVDASFLTGPGRGVRRTTLHAALVAAVDDAGIPILERSVKHVAQHRDRVEAAGVEARFLAAADGLHSPIRRDLGLDMLSTRTPRWGLRAHFRVAPWTDFVEVHWGRGLEAYVTPVDDALVGIALLTTARGGFAEQLAAFPRLVGLLRDSPATVVKGAGPLRQHSRTRRAGRVLLVGDAAGYVDALTGEGIAIGLATARELVRCVAADEPQAYERRWASTTRRYRWITESLLWSRSRRQLGARIVPAAHRMPRVFAGLVQQLAD